MNKRAVLRLVLALGIEFAEHEIVKAIVKEFIARGLDKVYTKEIERWKKYMREQDFAIKLNNQMINEIERFQRTIKRWTPKKLKEFVIEGLDCLK